jgi:putative sterol carrier protein
VYELTPLGQSLEKAVLELGKWGSLFLPTSLEGVALPSLGAITLAIKAFFHPKKARGIDETYELHLGNEVLRVQITDGELHVQQGAAQKADVILHTEMQVFVGLFAGQLKPEEAIAAGLVRVEGDRTEDKVVELNRFFKFTGVPGSPPSNKAERTPKGPGPVSPGRSASA